MHTGRDDEQKILHL